MRAPFVVLICLVLALTGQSMAVARGAAAATGQMVLCTGTGPMAVYTDAEGKPTSAPHICPDASLNVPSDVALPVAIFVAIVTSFVFATRFDSRQNPPALRLLPPSRAPPSIV